MKDKRDPLGFSLLWQNKSNEDDPKELVQCNFIFLSSTIISLS